MSYSQHVNHDSLIAQQFQVKTRKIVNRTLFILLSDEGVILNKSRRGKCDAEKDGCEGLVGACKNMLATHHEELRVQLDQLDLSPTSLCMSYHQLANGLLEDGCNWGKLRESTSMGTQNSQRALKNGYYGSFLDLPARTGFCNTTDGTVFPIPSVATSSKLMSLPQ